jgi:hypothetical protein
LKTDSRFEEFSVRRNRCSLIAAPPLAQFRSGEEGGTNDNSVRNPANPDPRKLVHWGDQSFDEMFLGWYNVTWDQESEAVKVAAKSEE